MEKAVRVALVKLGLKLVDNESVVEVRSSEILTASPARHHGHFHGGPFRLDFACCFDTCLGAADHNHTQGLFAVCDKLLPQCFPRAHTALDRKAIGVLGSTGDIINVNV